MRKHVIKIALIGFIAMISSCEKQKPILPDASQGRTLPGDVIKMSLTDFAKSRGKGLEQDFLLNTQITDNTNWLLELNKLSTKSNAKSLDDDKPRIVFKWHGFDPRTFGCTVPIGVCLIFGPEIMDRSDDPTPVSLKTIDQKLWIEFPAKGKGNFGLTCDGYLPIPVDIDIPNGIGRMLMLERQGMKIRAGIYKANFDESTNKYIGVTVDLK